MFNSSLSHASLSLNDEEKNIFSLTFQYWSRSAFSSLMNKEDD